MDEVVRVLCDADLRSKSRDAEYLASVTTLGDIISYYERVQ